MSNATKDNNHIPVLMGVSTVDGVTPVPIAVDPVTKRVLITLS